MVGALNANPNLIKTGAAMLDAFYVMLMLPWLESVLKIRDAKKKRTVQPRVVLYVMRVLFNGILSQLKSAVSTALFFKADSELAYMPCVSLLSPF